MIDSAVIQLNSEQFTVKDRKRFDASKTHGSKGYSVGTAYSSTYQKGWKKKGVYCPSFTLARRRGGNKETEEVLEIQFSLPKLIYGTNIFESDLYDMGRVNKNLLFFANGLGINTTIADFEQAIVRRVDFSKIVVLPVYLGVADRAIRNLSKFDYKPESDFRFDGYENGKNGSKIKFHNSTQGFVVYDKVGELKNNGYTKQEKGLIQKYVEHELKRNLIKLELSLQRKDSMEALLRRYIKTKKKNFTLPEIVSEKEAVKKILLNMFDTIYSTTHSGLITLSEMEENRLLDYLYSSKLSQHQVEKLFFWVRMATNFGIAGTWGRLKEVYSGGNVSANKNKIGQALIELGEIDGNVPNLLGFMRSELVKFEMIKPKSDFFFVNYF